MTRLIARLVLAMLILPLTGALFVLGIGIMAPFRGPPPLIELVALWFVIYVFVATYWVVLWRDMIRWTPSRVRQTLLASVAAVAAGGALGAFFWMTSGDVAVAFFLGGGLPPIVWVLATVLVWRETPQERMERITALGTDSVTCPVCGYNLTGLREARCPECGSNFTLDQLFSGQSKRDEATLEAVNE